jgi:hypothetical protein
MLRESNAYDPFAPHRRNPELMKRYFPQQTLAPGAPERQLALASPQINSGDAAVAGARLSTELKTAATEQQVRLAGREMQLYAVTGKLESNPSGRALSEYLTKTAAGRTFQLRNGVWIDTAFTTFKTATSEQIRFDSPEYWKFVGAHPELREIFALGTSIKFVLDGKIYEILPSAVP